MSDYDGRMGALAYEDALRFLARRKQEDLALGLDVPTAAHKRIYSARDYPGLWAASKPRTRCHGAAAMPPTPEAAEDLANGLIPATVLWTPRDGEAERVEDLATFTSRRQANTRTMHEAPVARTTAADLPPVFAD
jgi:hypothetical protein